MTTPEPAAQHAMDMEPAAPSKAEKRKREGDDQDQTEKYVAQTARVGRQWYVGSSKINEELKAKCLESISICFLSLHHKLKLPAEELMNLDVSTQITNILFTGYSILRQEANNTGEEIKKKAERSGSGFTVNTGGKIYDVRLPEVIISVKGSFQAMGLEFKKYGPKDKGNWYGTAGPYLDFFCGFGLRWKELRLGHSQMLIGKEEGKSKAFMVKNYGLFGGHHILLEGCTYPPEKRSSMVQSLGPMTILLCYIRSGGKYKEKWLAAAKRTFAFIPDIDQLLASIYGRPAHEIGNIIRILGDICRIITTRQATIAFLPLCMVASVVVTNELIAKLGFVRPARMMGGAVEMVPGRDLIKIINFSGKGAFLLWDMFKGCQMRMNGEWTEAEARQVMYHCTFGTFKEDLGVLSDITDCGNWFTREELGPKFKQHNTSGKTVIFCPVKQRLWPKLTRTYQARSETYFQVSCIPCFSGRRVQRFSNDFFENITRKIYGYGSSVRSARMVHELISNLSQLLHKLLEKVREDGNVLEIGTTAWFNMETTTLDDFQVETPYVAKTSGRYFV